MAEHEVMCGVAHLGAVQKQADVFRISVLAAFLQAVMNRVQTRVVAFFAGMNALVHLW